MSSTQETFNASGSDPAPAGQSPERVELQGNGRAGGQPVCPGTGDAGSGRAAADLRADPSALPDGAPLHLLPLEQHSFVFARLPGLITPSDAEESTIKRKSSESDR